jgi:methylphosphotriester-DNA--protein-cysteine methyltransferase
MRKIIGLFIVCLFCANTLTAGNLTFIGNKNTNKYHVSTCQYVKTIVGKNIIIFNTQEEAEQAGYTVCSRCKHKLIKNNQENKIMYAIKGNKDGS